MMIKKVDKVQLCETQIVRIGHQSSGILADYLVRFPNPNYVVSWRI